MRNPARRSRKIGLTQSGRGRDGRASEKWSHVFERNVWKDLSQRTAEGPPLIFTENPSRGFYHPAGGAEYLAVLDRLPAELGCGVKAIVLRRTPKADFRAGIEAWRRNGCVILNAFPRSNEMVWPSPPTAAELRHYGRWCSRWTYEPGDARLRWDAAEIRRYYLFHLFLHEVGHINQPWFHKLRRREGFAENFALEWAARLDELPPSVTA